MEDTNTKANSDNLIDRLFSAGAHFGFTKSRRHPSARQYIYTTKDGVDIFDLTQTSALLEDAKAVLKEAGKHNKSVLFVGTKEEASNLVKQYAEATEQPYVVNRWIGGMLTNFTEIKKRLTRLANLEKESESGELERKYTKRERVVIGREIDKLRFNFGGMKDMEKTPDYILVVDPRHDDIALTEARDLNIPVIGVVSSDNEIDKITHPVVVNDALQTSLELALKELSGAYNEGVAEGK